MKWFRKAELPLGQRGEQLAARFLKHKGYTILDQNVHLGRYEIDIIAREKDTIVFVEVRTRSEADAILPEDTIGPEKQLHISRAAKIYLSQHEDPDMYYRFDVVGVIMPEGGKPQITLYQDAFELV